MILSDPRNKRRLKDRADLLGLGDARPFYFSRWRVAMRESALADRAHDCGKLTRFDGDFMLAVKLVGLPSEAADKNRLAEQIGIQRHGVPA